MLDKLGPAASYRAMKIYGNLSKVLLHAHLLLFPKFRKTLPSEAPARRLAATPRKIPRIIWQTNYTQTVSLQVYTCFLYNRLRAPTFSYRFCDDAACDAFVAQNFPGRINEAYKRLQIGAARADFWRVLVLLKHGGIYMDIDANLTTNPDTLLNDDPDHVFIKMKSGEITNYFMASAPGNPVLQAVCDQIVANIEANEIKTVYDLTGPTVLHNAASDMGASAIIYKSACVQGQFINKAGQYVDKPNGAWVIAETKIAIVKQSNSGT